MVSVTFLRNYRYRLYPFRNQQRILQHQLDIGCDMYNSLLDLKQEIWRETKTSLSKQDLNNIITSLKIDNHRWNDIHSQVLQNVSDRITKAYDSFFRRVKEKKAGKKIKAGYPRFKKQVRYKSITFPQYGNGCRLISNKKLFVSGFGEIPIVLSRMPKGKIKTATIKIKTNKWYVIFTCMITQELPQHPHADREVGIDMGLTKFAHLSDDTVIGNERFYKQKEKRLKRLQRQLSRKKKGSHNRQKAMLRLAVEHEKIWNQRNDFQHKASRYIADNYGVIGVEGLNINGMLKNHRLAKHIADAGWGGFLKKTCYKAVSAGGMFIIGDRFAPSTQECSCCHALLKIPLSERAYSCPVCKTKLDRDLNASINRKPSSILSRDGQPRIYAWGDPTSTLQQKDCDASRVDEPKNRQRT